MDLFFFKRSILHNRRTSRVIKGNELQKCRVVLKFAAIKGREGIERGGEECNRYSYLIVCNSASNEPDHSTVRIAMRVRVVEPATVSVPKVDT